MKLQKCISLITILFFIFCCKGNASLPTVLIDPGHGGEEYGAQGLLYKNGKQYKIYEKDIALSISAKVLKKLKGKFNAYLTRSFDRTVTLQERAELAEKINADLFISVHINSSKNKKVRGIETYYLDNKRDAAIAKIERTENGLVFNDDPDIDHILTDILVVNTVDKSKKLADSIHKNLSYKFKKNKGVKNRGVKRGLFYVLALSKIPGVLLEVGFISNQKDLNKILNNDFQEKYAEMIAKGISDYFKNK